MTDKTFGRYTIIEELGQGGMAVVYRAHDPRFNRYVAIKVLPAAVHLDPTFRQRFEREAQTIAAMEHSAIVPVHDFGEHEGQPYLVMRYMNGGSLADRTAQGPLPPEETIRIMDRIGAALDAAHSYGIVHRDVKPGNILFDAYGDAYLSDFGIVKLSEATAQLTGSGIVGTPAYMAPEMAGKGGLTPLVDVYALGVTLYQMLTGVQPFEADTPMGLIMAHVSSPIPNILALRPDLPAGVQAVIEQALAKDPANRYQSAGELAEGLRQAMDGTDEAAPIPLLDQAVTQPIHIEPTIESAPPEAPAEAATVPEVQLAHEAPGEAVPQAAPPRKKKTWLWWVVGALCLVCIAVSVIVVIRILDMQPAEEPITEAPVEEPTAESSAEPVEEPEEPGPAAEEPVLGTEENPIVISFVAYGDVALTFEAANALTDILSDMIGLTIEAAVQTSSLVVVETMCAGEVHGGMLDAFSYIFANNDGCANVGLATIRYDAASYTGQFITRADSGIVGMADLVGTTFCRPEPSSLSGWIIPSITMTAHGLNPDIDLVEIIDVGSHDGVVSAVYSGDCAAGATFVDARSNVTEEFPDVMDVVVVVAETAEIPNDAISFSPEVSEEITDLIITALREMAEAEEEPMTNLMSLYGWTGLVEVDNSFYDGLRELLGASGVDVSQYID